MEAPRLTLVVYGEGVITINRLHRITCGIDVHKKSVMVSIARHSQASDALVFETKEFRSFRSDLRRMAAWLESNKVEISAMEGTGVYWKSVFEVLEEADQSVILVNARHIKQVPGRKTDVTDSQWLAQLAMWGLLKASFVPPRDIRELRILTRYRCKLVGARASEKNRMHKVLSDAGVRLGCVVSNIDGVAARKIIDSLIEGERDMLKVATANIGRLRASPKEVSDSLEANLSDRHRFVLSEIRDHIRNLDTSISKIDAQVVGAMKSYEAQWRLIQTIPGFDQISAAMLLAEIGSDMTHFPSKEHLASWAGVCPGNNESAGKKSLDELAKQTST